MRTHTVLPLYPKAVIHVYITCEYFTVVVVNGAYL